MPAWVTTLVQALVEFVVRFVSRKSRMQRALEAKARVAEDLRELVEETPATRATILWAENGFGAMQVSLVKVYPKTPEVESWKAPQQASLGYFSMLLRALEAWRHDRGRTWIVVETGDLHDDSVSDVWEGIGTRRALIAVLHLQQSGDRSGLRYVVLHFADDVPDTAQFRATVRASLAAMRRHYKAMV